MTSTTSHQLTPDAHVSVSVYGRHTAAGGGLDIKVEHSSTGWVIVRVGGHVDIATLPTLDWVLRDLTDGLGYQQIAVSLAGVAFLDSSGVKALLATLRRLHHADGELRVVDASPQAMRLFRMFDLDTIFGCGEPIITP
jgi:anti-sigma B factor antagonist